MSRKTSFASACTGAGFCETDWTPELNEGEKFFQIPPRPELLSAGAAAGAGDGAVFADF
jgi:hypothetical protein